GVPSSTALRWLKCLEQRGLVVRTANTSDASSASVQLSLEGSRVLRRYVREVVEARQRGEGAGTLEP
ncbi:MAG: MarR family transcriptional regulator, partial [Sphingomicrobium sp.]